MGAAVVVVDIPMTLSRAVDAIGPVQTGIEPLRRIRRTDLCRQHVTVLVVKGAGIIFAVEVSAFPSPVGPGAGHAFEHLPGGALAAVACSFGQGGERDVVRAGSPQPFRDVGFGNLDQMGGHPGAAEILLGKNIRGDGRPFGRNFDALQLENDRTVGIADFGVGNTKSHSFEWRFSCLRIPTPKAHRRSPVSRSRALICHRDALDLKSRAHM